MSSYKRGSFKIWLRYSSEKSNKILATYGIWRHVWNLFLGCMNCLEIYDTNERSFPGILKE